MAIKKTATRGPHGAAGPKGKRGATGPAGPAGVKGPQVQHAEVLAVVDSEIGEIRKHLETQIVRTAQMQQKLDEIHMLLKQLIERERKVRIFKLTHYQTALPSACGIGRRQG